MPEISRYHRLSDAWRSRAHSPRSCDWSLVERINKQCSSLATCADTNLAETAGALRRSIRSGESVLDTEVVVAAFALTKEAARRTIGCAHYDVQLLAGIALATGAIAEMQTGEGKTLASTLPAVLYGLAGNGVHIATVNAYLAKRDFELLRPLYELLALSVGYAKDNDSPDKKRKAYSCDVTYATGYDLGFDYLRDQVSIRTVGRERAGRSFRNGLRGTASSSKSVQRGHAFVVIDEVDSVLVDEANTPLILSEVLGDNDSGTEPYLHARSVARKLRPDIDFTLDHQPKRIRLTDTGASQIHLELPQGLARPWSTYVEQALRAEHLYHRDMHYVIPDDEVMIVDEYTGRIFTERSWRDGLHQAVEAKEGVPITQEKHTIARISRQQYFQMYDCMCGMTGTASGHEEEFRRFYRLPVVSIPLRKPCLREELPTRYFSTAESKWSAIADDVVSRHAAGQPVLVGTRTIANSKCLASLLTRAKVAFRLLNGLQDEDEAALVTSAGEHGVITIATNMAGRGTDIEPDGVAKTHGGLHVIAAERHDSSRIDRQLVGRAARQGEPGSCQFFVSAEDALITDNDMALANKLVASGSAGEFNSEFDSAIRRIQSRAEKTGYEKRTELLKHELWLDKLRASVA